MTTADGQVVGTTQIVTSGPATERWNLVILSDGYQDGQLAQFATDAQAFVNTLFATAPFDRLRDAINVFRVDVSSTDAGADNPCANPPVSAATFFDARFCESKIPRLLVIDPATVLTTAAAQVPQFHRAIVIVNSTTYGGSGGQVAVYSRAQSAQEVALHELGHSEFGLADEYEYLAGCGVAEGHDVHPFGEPAEPNVTLDPNRATNKWRDLVASTTNMPTTTNANCAQCDPQASPVPVGTIGAFEGAHYYHCGAYRPAIDCRMRALGQPYCDVCQRVIERRLAPFLPAHNHVAVIAVDPGARKAYLDAIAAGTFVGAVDAMLGVPHWLGSIIFPLGSSVPAAATSLPDIRRRLLASFPAPAFSLTTYLSLTGDPSAGSPSVRDARRELVRAATNSATSGGAGSVAAQSFEIDQNAMDLARAHGIVESAIIAVDLAFKSVSVAIIAIVDLGLYAQYSAQLKADDRLAAMQTAVQQPHLLGFLSFVGESDQTVPASAIDVLKPNFVALLPPAAPPVITFPEHFSQIDDMAAGTAAARDARLAAIRRATTTATGAGGVAPGTGVLEVPPAVFDVAKAASIPESDVIVVVGPSIIV
jgi:IgA Peptidase M64